MSSRQGVYISMGVMIMVIIGMSMNFYSISKANDAVNETKQLILEGREIGNKRGNQTLGAVGEAITEIKKVSDEILGNLTSHRLVTNDTNTQVQELQNQTNILLEGFNETNEVERQKAVNKILEGIQNNTDLLEKLSSITP